MDGSHIGAMITALKQRENQKKNLYECDYSCITSAILPYYFHVTKNTAWVITPEFNYLEDNHPNYTIFYVDPEHNYVLRIHAVVKVKSKSDQSWHELLEQMSSQADVAKNPEGKLGAIGQKGLEICVFEFNVKNYKDQKPDCFTFYKPLNLGNLEEGELDRLGVEYEHCEDNGSARLALIKGRLDNEEHIVHINRMLQYLISKQP